MVDSLHRLPVIPGRTGPVSPGTSAPATRQTDGQFNKLFEQELQQATPLQFSGHAQSRLQTRQIELSAEQMGRLERGVSQAARKGARDSLVMVDNLAFIVSVANRTVVTAVDGAAAGGNVFTKIDSAVIA